MVQTGSQLCRPHAAPGPHHRLLDVHLQGSPQCPVRLGHILPEGHAHHQPGHPLPRPRARLLPPAGLTAAWQLLLRPPGPPPSPGDRLPLWLLLRALCPAPSSGDSQPALPPRPSGVARSAQTSSGGWERCGVRGQAQPGYRISQAKDGEKAKGTGPQNRCKCRAGYKARSRKGHRMCWGPQGASPSPGHCLCGLGAAGCVGDLLQRPCGHLPGPTGPGDPMGSGSPAPCPGDPMSPKLTGSACPRDPRGPVPREAPVCPGSSSEPPQCHQPCTLQCPHWPSSLQKSMLGGPWPQLDQVVPSTGVLGKLLRLQDVIVGDQAQL